MDYSLTDSDFGKYIPGAFVLGYNELKKWRSIWDIFAASGKEYFVVLYQQTPIKGHWVGVLTSHDKSGNKVIEVYDPYGVKVDHQFKATKLLPSYRYLSALLLKSGVPIHYNHVPVQAYGQGINTCGRHVIHRIINKHIELDRFLQLFFMDAQQKNMSTDELVTYYYHFH